MSICYSLCYNERMKIGINASFLRKAETGIGQVTTHFLAELVRSEGNSPIFAKDEFFVYLEEDTELALAPNFHKRVLKPLYRRDDLLKKFWWERFAMPKQAKEDGCEGFVNLYQNPAVFPDATRHVMVVHDIIPEMFPEYLNNSRKRLYWQLTKSGMRQADHILAVSMRTEKDLIQRMELSADKVSVAYIDVDPLFQKPVSEMILSQAMRTYGLRPGYIYYGGGLDTRKNVEGLLRAFKLLIEESKREAEWKPGFLVISGTPMPGMAPLVTDVESVAKSLNLLPYVKILGRVPQRLLPALYRNASLFVFPSKYEGFGMPVVEAMRIGTPVAASKTGSLPEIGSDAILYFDPEKPRDMAQVIKRILTNTRLHRELSERGKTRADDFSWKRFVHKALTHVKQSA